LRTETPGAIDLLQQQSDDGKDMMRLISDLIAYLRDLLVFKAKPDALKEDVEADVQTSLAAHAELVTTDRLLDLVDQFAAAEGRMKWVPNKKLHFEVAIIKAIQSLGQATLDEVIEKLSQLRDGKIVPQKNLHSGGRRLHPARSRHGPTLATAVSDSGHNKRAAGASVARRE
jgi:DNA polymerase-3 subunit gamma/tau